jgi:DNA-directed RNA polymerase specialized sigma24 family protein
MPSEPGASFAKTLEDDRFLAAIRRLRAGEADEQSSRLLDERLRPRLLRYFLSHAFSREDAEDLVQKTLPQVFLGMGRLRAEESFRPWLFTIARNLAETLRLSVHTVRNHLAQARKSLRRALESVGLEGEPGQ